MCLVLASMLTQKELHCGGNYMYIPILSKSVSWSKPTHDKTALWHHTVSPMGKSAFLLFKDKLIYSQFALV